jgi:integrase
LAVATVVKYELNDKTVRWRVRYRDANNRSASQSGFLTGEAAKVFAAELTMAKAAGTALNRGSRKKSIGVYIDQHMSHTVRLSPSTIANRKSISINHVLPVWGGVPLMKVTKKGVTDWVETMHQDGIGPETIRKAHGILLASFAIAMDDRAIGSNPASGVKVPRPQKPTNTYLTHQEVIELADAIDPRSRALIGLLAYSGLRFGEITALRVGKVNMVTRRLTIDRAATSVGGVLTERQPKFNKNRQVYFPEVLGDAMQKLVEGKRKSDYVFTTARGGAVNLDGWRPRVFNTAIERINEARAKRAALDGSTFDDFPAITPHDLRHTAASIAVSSGANVKVLQKMLGHASAAMTLDRYADLFDSDDVSASNAINAQIIERVGSEAWSVRHI